MCERCERADYQADNVPDDYDAADEASFTEWVEGQLLAVQEGEEEWMAEREFMRGYRFGYDAALSNYTFGGR